MYPVFVIQTGNELTDKGIDPEVTFRMGADSLRMDPLFRSQDTGTEHMIVCR